MVNFRTITEGDFDAVINMKRPEGEGFVASNAVSLAQAWLYRDNRDVFPFAIYDGDTLAGFMLVEEDMTRSGWTCGALCCLPSRKAGVWARRLWSCCAGTPGIPGGISTCSFFARPKTPPPGTSMTSWASALPERSASETWKGGWSCKPCLFIRRALRAHQSRQAACRLFYADLPTAGENNRIFSLFSKISCIYFENLI